MDDATFIATAAVAPLSVGTVLWFFIRGWISRVEKDIKENEKNILESKYEVLSALKETNSSIVSIRIELAEAGIKKTAEKVDLLAERIVVAEGRLNAAWRTLENKGLAEKRVSDN
jgi:hypothetical protein